MPLRTFEEVRPWASAIKRRVSNREMPPWFADRTIGIQDYADNPSLTDAQIATIVKWVDAGAALGNPADMPAPRQFAAAGEWSPSLGRPDLVVVEDKEFVVPPAGADQFVTQVTPTGLTEDRWIRAVEARPTVSGRRIVHHMIATAVEPPSPGKPRTRRPNANSDTRIASGGEDSTYLIEYVPGTTPDVLPENSGRLLKAGSHVSFATHYHSIGEEIRDHVEMAIWFYPKGYVPKYKVETTRVRPQAGADNNYLDIAPNTARQRFDGYFRLEKAAKVISFEPHMHYRGQAMRMEAILPNGFTVQLTSVPNFDWSWQIAYTYATPPAFPAGTVLHTVSYFDNSAANKRNPDPSAWVGFGQRTIDEMANGWTDFVYIDDTDFKAAVAAGDAPGTSAALSTSNN
jgi:hypothetical protein